jgi:hypothetical protein
MDPARRAAAQQSCHAGTVPYDPERSTFVQPLAIHGRFSVGAFRERFFAALPPVFCRVMQSIPCTSKRRENLMRILPIHRALGLVVTLSAALAVAPACSSRPELTCKGPDASDRSYLYCINSNCSSQVSDVLSDCPGSEACLSSCNCNDTKCAETCVGYAGDDSPPRGAAVAEPACVTAVDSLQSCEASNDC